MAHLDRLITGTMTAAKTVSATLKSFKRKNEEYEKENPHSTLAAWRINKLNTSALRYQKALQAFNAASASFKAELRKKTARQARMVNQDITEEQIEQIVESNDPTAFMQQALMIPEAMLDRIEKNVEQTLDYVQKGKIQLEKANASQMSARRTMCCFCVCIVVAAVIGVVASGAL